MDPNNQKKALLFLGIAAGAYFLYRIFSKDDNVQEAVVSTVTAPVKIVETSVKKVNQFIKGSPEAKAHMKKLAGMRKRIGRKKKVSESPGAMSHAEYKQRFKSFSVGL